MPDPQIGLDDLVANGTMSADVAEALRETARARRSFLVMAVPRLAGKTTVMQAMLAESGVPSVALGYDGDDVGALVERGRDGYLVVPEVSRGAWAPGYVWGEPVRRAFAGIAGGTSLAAALHAPDPGEAFGILGAGCGVPVDDVARLGLVVYLRAFGPPESPTHRRVATVHRVAGVRDGKPDARLLFRWIERGDRFERLAETGQG